MARGQGQLVTGLFLQANALHGLVTAAACALYFPVATTFSRLYKRHILPAGTLINVMGNHLILPGIKGNRYRSVAANWHNGRKAAYSRQAGCYHPLPWPAAARSDLRSIVCLTIIF